MKLSKFVHTTLSAWMDLRVKVLAFVAELLLIFAHYLDFSKLPNSEFEARFDRACGVPHIVDDHV